MKMQFGRYDYAAFWLFGFYAACSLGVPMVLVGMAQALDFPLTAGGMGMAGLLQIARSIPMVAAMLLCGFFGARYGLRRVLGIAAALMGAGIFITGFAPGYLWVVGALALAGLGEGTVEGLGTPLVQELHRDTQPGRYINFAHSFWSVGVLISVLAIGGALSMGMSWRAVLLLIGGLTLIPVGLLLFPARRRIAAIEARQGAEAGFGDTWQKTLTICRCPHFWLFFAAMFVAGGGEFCLTFWCASFIQLEFGSSAWLGGVGTGSFALGMFVGRSGSGLLVPQRYLKQLIVLCALGALALSMLLPLLHSPWLLAALLFPVGLLVAPFWPSVQSYCVDRVPLDSTMLFVLLSCAGVPGCGFFTLLMGLAGDRWGLRGAFWLVPFCFAVLAVLIGVDWWRSERKKI